MRSRGAAVAVSAALFLVTFPAHAARPTYVTHNCRGVKREPGKILFACGDGNYYVNHLKWSSWGRRRAEATGVFHFNDCNPSCAEGEFHRREGTLVLRYRKFCDDVDKYVFRQARVTYKKPRQGERRERFGLECPLP